MNCSNTMTTAVYCSERMQVGSRQYVKWLWLSRNNYHIRSLAQITSTFSTHLDSVACMLYVSMRSCR